MKRRVQVRTSNAMVDIGRNTQLTTTNFVPMYSGSMKFDDCPDGGGIAGVIESNSPMMST